MKLASWIAVFGVLLGCGVKPTATKNQTTAPSYAVKRDTLTWYDPARSRKIPLAFYMPQAAFRPKKQGIVIFSHGYGQNKGDSYLTYTYLTAFLAEKGYLVVSIQHELPHDPLIPSAGIPQVVRRPFWERGAENIHFVLRQLKTSHPHLNFEDISLIGHSNGGDMTALFAQKYPHWAKRIITLDHRRMAFPRTKNPKIYSLRSSDQVADAGVLPSEAEQVQFGIQIIQLPNTIHNDMDDHATLAQRQEITGYIWAFLKN